MKNVVQDEAWKEGMRATLDELAREGARRMIAAALEVEVDEYERRFAEDRDEAGHAKVVRSCATVAGRSAPSRWALARCG
jgi:putative transposase